MKETSGMFDQMTFADLLSATSSPESEGGASRSVLQGGQTIDRFGLDHAHANLSARQASELGLLTSGTYGQRLNGSFERVDLSRLWANRLRARTDLLGSTLFTLTWKARVTPLGLSICALRASARHTSAKDYGSVPTPQVFDTTNMTGNLANRKLRGGCSNLKDVVGEFQPVPTPKVQNANSPGEHGQGGKDLQTVTQEFESVPTPNTLDTILLEDSGQDASGNSAETESTVPGKGTLNAQYSRWLMGYPPIWCIAARLAILSLSKVKKVVR